MPFFTFPTSYVRDSYAAYDRNVSRMDAVRAGILSEYTIDEPLGKCAAHTARELFAEYADDVEILRQALNVAHARIDALERGRPDPTEQASRGTNGQSVVGPSNSFSIWTDRKTEELEQYIKQETCRLEESTRHQVQDVNARVDYTLTELESKIEKRMLQGLESFGENILKRTGVIQANATQRVRGELLNYMKTLRKDMEEKIKTVEDQPQLEEAMEHLLSKVSQLEKKVSEESTVEVETRSLLKKCEGRIARLEEAQKSLIRALNNKLELQVKRISDLETQVNPCVETLHKRVDDFETRLSTSIEGLDKRVDLNTQNNKELQHGAVLLERLVTRLENGARQRLGMPFVEVPALDGTRPSEWDLNGQTFPALRDMRTIRLSRKQMEYALTRYGCKSIPDTEALCMKLLYEAILP